MSAYLDHNATSPAPQTVIDAVAHAMTVVGNASAQHSHGRAAAKLVADAREAIGMAMGQCAQDVLFTGSGTEAINTAIHAAVSDGCQHLIISSLDHPASIMAAEASGVRVSLLPATPTGQTDFDALADILNGWDAADGRPFLSLVAANSETGVIQNTDRAIDLIQDAGGLILIDAVQALGKLPMLYPADYVAVSAHKIGGPQGVGALYVSPEAPFTPLMHGGGHERRRRAGTLNVPGIAGFGAATAVMGDRFDRAEHMRDTLQAELKAIDPDIVIFGEGEARLPNTLFIAAPGLRAMTAMMAFDLEGLSVSTGTACSSGKVGESRALRAMGRIEDAPDGAIRVSFGPGNTMDDVEAFASAWRNLRKARKAA
ncbi:cysteine desulfurase family protein [Algimonas porphyrae]|uniref:Cysteine desulfurase n=1 Tax=Algimonas porphyrae TaxID=1128113 RepID=A0ABQ5UVD0_9PROT|nr:cysteine desulfurase family protein [Algimonas porphyrae]GLQ19230.1 cysteine desulfurase [Algimonas porphyrae]